MIVCSCRVLTEAELDQAAREIRLDPERGVVTPGAVFRQLEQRPKCGNCFPTVIRIIHEMNGNHEDK